MHCFTCTLNMINTPIDHYFSFTSLNYSGRIALANDKNRGEANENLHKPHKNCKACY